MRFGYTTGSCAAAAAKAATFMLLSGKVKEKITIITPKGIPYTADILDMHRTETSCRCAVQKDGGDDPDITTGALIYAEVSLLETEGTVMWIDGGEGVGRVTKPGLDQPVGNAAINRIPREMIRKEVMEVCNLMDYTKGIQVIISVPQGEMLAKQTFNPRLGIEGGISILGTSGIVEPMSSQAIIDTIRVELRQHRARGETSVIVSPGNYGMDFMKKAYGYDLERSIKCSNYIGVTIDMAVELGFRKLLIVGHVGKLVKVAGGIMNTHSKEADARMEILAACALRENVEDEILREMLACVTTEEALQVLKRSSRFRNVMQQVVEKICYYMGKRAEGKLKIDCIIYTNELGELAKSKEAEQWFTLLEQEQEP